MVTVTNSGNARLEIALAATDPEKVITPRVTPERVLLEAGRSCDVLVEVRGPRMILGAELDRPVTVTATATVDGTPDRSRRSTCRTDPDVAAARDRSGACPPQTVVADCCVSDPGSPAAC